MWPCKNEGEDARLYKAVEACSDFACSLGINIPTGKDSLSMTQKYGDKKVLSPGTVIISAGAEVADVKQVVSPVVKNDKSSSIYYIDFSFDNLKLGGSVLYQCLGKIGNDVPTVQNPEYFADAFNSIQALIANNYIMAGHDISEGGLITALLEMTFANTKGGLCINLSSLAEKDTVKLLFSENPGVFIQTKNNVEVEKLLTENGIGFAKIGYPIEERSLIVVKDEEKYTFDIDAMRDVWYRPSYLLDRKQSGEQCAPVSAATVRQRATRPAKRS
jgi:phosphoribosylformylglycinamidine synthase